MCIYICRDITLFCHILHSLSFFPDTRWLQRPCPSSLCLQPSPGSWSITATGKMLKEHISNMNHKEDNLWAYYACLPMYKGLTWKREKRLYCCFRMRTSDKSFKTWFDSNVSESISHSQCCQGVERAGSLSCAPGSSGKTKLRLRHRWWWRRSYLPRKLL